MAKRPVLGPQRRTNPLIWFLAFIFAIVFTIIIIAGIVVFVGYLAIRPKVPLLYVQAARLDQLVYDQTGDMAVRIFVMVRAENHNVKAHVSFYDTDLILGYHGLIIAKLVAGPFDVRKNTSQELSYVVESSPIPLNSHLQALTEHSLDKSKSVLFFIKGTSRTRWRVGPMGSVKFWLHINCHMLLPINRSVVYPNCSRKSH